MKKTRNIIIIAIILGIILLAAIVSVVFMNLPTTRLNRELKLAQKYLLEENYEEAILAYTHAIEIDPTCTEAYIGLADATYVQHTSQYAAANRILDMAELNLKSASEVTPYRQQVLDQISLIDETLDILDDGYDKASDDAILDKRSEFLFRKAELTVELAEKSEYWRYAGSHILREDVISLLDMAAADYNSALNILNEIKADATYSGDVTKDELVASINASLSEIEKRRQIIESMEVTINNPIYHNMYMDFADRSFRDYRLIYKIEQDADGSEHIICETTCGMVGTMSTAAIAPLNDMIVAEFEDLDGNIETGGSGKETGGLGFGLGLKDTSGNVIYDIYHSNVRGWDDALYVGHDGVIYYKVSIFGTGGGEILPAAERIAQGDYLLYTTLFLSTEDDKNHTIGIYSELPVSFR